MASVLVLKTNDNFTEKKSRDKASCMSTCTTWNTSRDTAATNTESPLSLDDILIHLPHAKDNAIPSSSHLSPQEMEHHSNCSAENGLVIAEGETVLRQRRIGVVEASDTVGGERMNARVLRKKFGEGLVSEMPGIFNKKL